MKKLITLLSGLAFVAGMATAQNNDDANGANGQQTEPHTQFQGMETVQLGGEKGQQYLVDSEGRTLYLFTDDEEGVSNCSGDCLANWPAYTASGDLTAGDGLDPELLGTIEREDGTKQVTFNGHPLYYYVGDEAAGAVAGQGLNDKWYVLDMNGDAFESFSTNQGTPDTQEQTQDDGAGAPDNDDTDDTTVPGEPGGNDGSAA